MPPEDTSLYGRLRSKWWAFAWWLDDRAPLWMGRLFRRLKDFHYRQISTRLWPRQKWLTDRIPRCWEDKTTIIPDLLFACVIHYVDGEKCFEQVVIEEPLATELRACYDWAKTGRAAAEKVKEDSWHPGPLKQGSFEMEKGTGSMEEYIRLEHEIVEQDTKWLVWIVQHRDYLWT